MVLKRNRHIKNNLFVSSKPDANTEWNPSNLGHRRPDSTRVFPGGHMGQTPETFPTIVNWLKHELRE